MTSMERKDSNLDQEGQLEADSIFISEEVILGSHLIELKISLSSSLVAETPSSTFKMTMMMIHLQASGLEALVNSQKSRKLRVNLNSKEILLVWEASVDLAEALEEASEVDLGEVLEALCLIKVALMALAEALEAHHLKCFHLRLLSVEVQGLLQ